jgi:hypothetical protein
LSPEEQKYYENYFDLFLTDGWKQFVQEAKEILNSHSIDDLKTEKDLSQLQGQRVVLLNIIRFETGIQNAFEELSNND